MTHRRNRLLPSFLLAFALLSCAARSQSLPPILWQQSFGGTGSDKPFSLVQTSDGGYLVGGTSSSGTSGNKSAPAFGGNDFWVVRLDANGTQLWDRAFGGSGDDGLFSMQQTADGGFVLGGYSTSGVSGTKTSPNYGARDFWIVRLDTNGASLWDKSYGGADDDGLFALRQTSDGGFICAGYSYSVAGGTKTSTNFGGSDFWVVRLDTNGNKLWDKTFGGTNDDTCYSLVVTTNGGFLLAGSSLSDPGGNKTSPNYGATDFWLVSLDASGNKLWDRSFGGSGDDGYTSVSVAMTSDGGFIVGGDSTSGANGNKTSSNFGSEDFWVVRLDSNGNKVWDRSFGGTGTDYLTSLQVAPGGGFILAGGTTSGISGNKASLGWGSTDFWAVRLDDNGNKLWDQTYGGTGLDAFDNLSAIATSDGGFVLAGDSSSGVSGNKTSLSFGGADFWVLRLGVGVSRPSLRALPQQNVVANGFHFLLSGQSNQSYVIERSSAIQPASWVPISTNQLAGTEMELSDPGARTTSRGFYRARLWP